MSSGVGAAGDLDRRGHRHAPGPTDQDPFGLGHAPGGEEALLVGDGDDLVVQVRVPRRREEVLADALDEVWPP